MDELSLKIDTPEEVKQVENKYTQLLFFWIPIITLVILLALYVKILIIRGGKEIDYITKNSSMNSLEAIAYFVKKINYFTVFQRVVKYLSMPVLVTYMVTILDKDKTTWKVPLVCIYVVMTLFLTVIPGEETEFLLDTLMSPLTIALIVFVLLTKQSKKNS